MKNGVEGIKNKLTKNEHGFHSLKNCEIEEGKS